MSYAYPTTRSTTTSYVISTSSTAMADAARRKEEEQALILKTLEGWQTAARAEQPKLSSLAKKINFHYTIGIELTFVPEVFNKAMDRNNTHPRWEELAEEYQGLVHPLALGNTEAVHADPGCVEYPSPILETWEHAHMWYGVSCAIAKSMGLVPEHENQEGGMGHIHIGLNEIQIAHIHADLIARPYLTWIFATPNGSQYCKSLARAYMRENKEPRFPLVGSEFEKVGRRMRADSTMFTTVMTWTSYDWRGQPYMKDLWHEEQFNNNLHLLTTDRFSIAPRNAYHNTMEWRAFDSAPTWREQEEHIAFLQRYCFKILEGADSYPAAPFGQNLSKLQRDKTLKSFIDAYRNDKDACVRDFKDLIVNTLELPWNRYEWYLERNLDTCV